MSSQTQNQDDAKETPTCQCGQKALCYVEGNFYCIEHYPEQPEWILKKDQQIKLDLPTNEI